MVAEVCSVLVTYTGFR